MAIRRGMESLRVQRPQTAVEWADKHFYLSPESSYVEGPWTTQPVQKAILNAMGNDDIREVDFRKSARIGYTKMLLAATLYLAEHKRRNIGLWREDDSAAAEFVNTELDPAIRDCSAIKEIFPDWHKKSENNKVDYKKLLGCSLHIRGGQAAGGYRALSKDVVIGDEIDGFVQNVSGKSSKEGDPITLMFKRTKGSSFPKVILGTTPTTSTLSHIERREHAADVRLRCWVPCPHCQKLQYLKWGGPGLSYGIKWDKHPSKTDTADSARYLCEHCACEFGYHEFIDVISEADPLWLDDENGVATYDGIHYFDHETGREVKTPRHVCFIVWAAYSPTTPWSEIVGEYLDAKPDRLTFQGFVNTTLGEYWHDDVARKIDGTQLYKHRREHYPKASDNATLLLPRDVLYITAGVDTQGNRFAWEIVGWGKGEQSWSIEYRELLGNLAEQSIWDQLAQYMRRNWQREDGMQMGINLVFHDSGGGFTDDVYRHAAAVDPAWWIPVKGDGGPNRPIVSFSSKKVTDHGSYLAIVGTNNTSDLMANRFEISEPDTPGFCHWPYSEYHTAEYFNMLTAEERKLHYVGGRETWRWECPKGKRNEAHDCRRYATAAVKFAQQYLGLDLTNGITPTNSNSAPQQERRKSDYWNR